jgi:hypothetical protein
MMAGSERKLKDTDNPSPLIELFFECPPVNSPVFESPIIMHGNGFRLKKSRLLLLIQKVDPMMPGDMIRHGRLSSLTLSLRDEENRGNYGGFEVESMLTRTVPEDVDHSRPVVVTKHS